jgi:hypothetical protein
MHVNAWVHQIDYSSGLLVHHVEEFMRLCHFTLILQLHEDVHDSVIWKLNSIWLLLFGLRLQGSVHRDNQIPYEYYSLEELGAPKCNFLLVVYHPKSCSDGGPCPLMRMA